MSTSTTSNLSTTGTNIKPMHETSHPLYVIYSRWSFDKITGLLHRYTDNPEADIGTLKTDFDNNLKDTFRTFVLLTDRLADALANDGFNKSFADGNKSGFSFSKFRIRDDFNLANKSLCIPIPRQLGAKGKEVETMIQSKLYEAMSFDIISENQYTIIVNLLDRETDQPASTAFISFDSSVTDETIAVIKALIHNTYWPDKTNKFVLNCRYALSSDKTKTYGARNKDGKKPFFKAEA